MSKKWSSSWLSTQSEEFYKRQAEASKFSSFHDIVNFQKKITSQKKVDEFLVIQRLQKERPSLKFTELDKSPHFSFQHEGHDLKLEFVDFIAEHDSGQFDKLKKIKLELLEHLYTENIQATVHVTLSGLFPDNSKNLINAIKDQLKPSVEGSITKNSLKEEGVNSIHIRKDGSLQLVTLSLQHGFVNELNTLKEALQKIIYQKTQNASKQKGRHQKKAWLVIDLSGLSFCEELLDELHDTHHNYTSPYYSKIIVLGPEKAYRFPKPLSGAAPFIYIMSSLPLTTFGFYLCHFSVDQWSSKRLSTYILTLSCGLLFALGGCYFIGHQIKKSLVQSSA